MAEFVSIEAAKVAAGSKLRNDEALGRVHVLTITAPAVAAYAQNDTIASPVIIPKGSRILGAKVYNGAAGAGVTLDVGLRQTDSDQTVIDANGIASAIAIATAGVSDASNGALVSAGTITSAESNVYLTLGGANPTDNVALRVDVLVALAG